MKKIVLGILIVGWLCGAGFACAAGGITINEIMYDLKDLSDTDHEWVELYNASDVAISIQGWKFNDGSNHSLNAPPANGGQGSLSIEAGGYAILSGNAAVYLADHPGFTGTVIDTVMSLNNSSATLSVANQSGTIIDSISYTSSLGGNGDGRALSRSATTLVPSVPTPGYQNNLNTTPNQTDTTSNTNTEPDTTDTTTSTDTNEAPSGGTTTTVVSGSLPQQTAKSVEVKTKFIPVDVKIIAPSKLTVGVPSLFSVKATGTIGEQLHTGNFVWSFGDGGIVTQTTTDEFAYTYTYPGEYVVYLDYYQFKDQQKPVATHRKTVKVIASSLTLSNMHADGSFDITNTGNQEIDLIGWSISNGSSLFTFSNHLIVLPKDKITITQKVTHFDTMATRQLTLIDPSGTQTGLFKSNSTTTTNPIEVKSVVKKVASSTPEYVQKQPIKVVTKSEPQRTQENSRSKMIYFGFGSIIVITLLSFLFLQQKKKAVSPLFSEIEVVDKIS